MVIQISKAKMLTISSAKSIFATLTSAVGGASNTSLYSIKHLKQK